VGETNVDFEDWIVALDQEFQKIGWGYERYMQQTGSECWREMFDDGLTPSEAVSEELSAAAH
jgi:hypothetical protein